MTQEKTHKQNMDHEDWLDNMAETQEKARFILFEVWETFRILLDKGVTRAIREIKFFFSKTTFVDYIGGGLIALMGVFATLILATGLCLIGYQIGLWLIDGVWTEFPLFIVFNFLFENTALHSWITNPESMYGLQKDMAGESNMRAVRSIFMGLYPYIFFQGNTIVIFTGSSSLISPRGQARGMQSKKAQ